MRKLYGGKEENRELEEIIGRVYGVVSLGGKSFLVATTCLS